MKRFNYPKGKKGEEIAGEFLEKKGYKILESNFRTRFGEVDLICQKDPSTSSGQAKLVFVEVKLKVGDEHGSPEEMINKRKVSQVQRTAISYLMQNPKIKKDYLSYQIDAVCIVLSEENSIKRISHYENVGAQL